MFYNFHAFCDQQLGNLVIFVLCSNSFLCHIMTNVEEKAVTIS
jgi:hypothetical protein